MIDVQLDILDPCCGSRMMWFDKNHPGVVFGDQRSETLTVKDQSNGRIGGTRTLQIAPDHSISEVRDDHARTEASGNL